MSAEPARESSKIILKPEVKKGFTAMPDGLVKRMDWSKLMARVFKTDVLRCQPCGAKLYPENFEIITIGPIVAGILLALGLSATPPARQQGPPRLAFDDYDMDQRQPYLD